MCTTSGSSSNSKEQVIDNSHLTDTNHSISLSLSLRRPTAAAERHRQSLQRHLRQSVSTHELIHFATATAAEHRQSGGHARPTALPCRPACQQQWRLEAFRCRGLWRCQHQRCRRHEQRQRWPGQRQWQQLQLDSKQQYTGGHAPNTALALRTGHGPGHGWGTAERTESLRAVHTAHQWQGRHPEGSAGHACLSWQANVEVKSEWTL